MNYTQIDPDQVRTDILKTRALELEQKAYAVELEAERLHRLTVEAPKGLSKDTYKAAQEEALANSEVIRRKADRSRIGIDVSNDEIRQVRVAFLKAWIGSLEKDHATHVTLREERVRILSDEAEELSAEETANINANIQASHDACVVIESAHKLALEELAELDVEG